jgi:hypothetical protein
MASNTHTAKPVRLTLDLAQGLYDVLFTHNDVLDPVTKETVQIRRAPGLYFSKQELVNLCNYVLSSTRLLREVAVACNLIPEE